VLDGPAPNFHLVDQYGRPVSLATLRGETVAMTFLDPVCTTDCPTIAQEFLQANQLLESDSHRTRFVAIVANPIFNSLADVRAFNRQEGLTQPNWLFLTGSRSALESLWNAYGVPVSTAPAGAMIDHANLAYVIDAHGMLRRGLDADPGPGEPADQSSFSALLAEQMQEVMH
jgi:protein SCO1/2